MELRKTKHPTPAALPATIPQALPPINPDALYRWHQVRQYIPVSKAAWYEGVRQGRYPASVKLGPSTTCWRGSDLLKLVQEGTGHE
jgi:predicted DNA-binding transcriptional regulator AlpA